MQVHGVRPRVLKWYHAGPMLFGDWGTSRLYVLGLCFAFTGRASIWYLGAMSLLLVAVGWAYEVICEHFPDGGGVYSAARERSPALAVIGGLLLCADYVVTAALSALDAFHYLNLPHPQLWAAGGILLVGVINFFGPTKAGMIALFVALGTVIGTLVIAIAAIPSLGNVVIERPTGSPVQWWSHFTSIILAISGVEAVANMTGIMVQPVASTARKSIWPVLCEIVLLNLLLTLAMQAVPLSVLGDGDPSRAYSAHRDDMLRVLAEHYVGKTFAAGASLLFAALLLSAVNTAISDLVSIQFMMARDRELPGAFGALNQWGMPVLPLCVATAVPLVTVLLAPDVGVLAELYAIGVVGAITINLSACGSNRRLNLSRFQTWAMLSLAAFMAVVWVTIAYEKPRALAFASGILLAGLAARWVSQRSSSIGQWMTGQLQRSGVSGVLAESDQQGLPSLTPVPIPVSHRDDWRRVLVATRGNPRIIEFAAEQARLLNAELLVLFVRHIAVAMAPIREDEARYDADANRLQAMAGRVAATKGIPFRFIYAAAMDQGDAILDIAVTHGADMVILGTSRRGSLWRTMKGDVIQSVAENLPESIQLVVHA